MQLRNRQDFWSGVMFIVLGLGFSWQASSYQMGTAARMGPGYFPFWLGLVLALLGAIVLISALSKKATETAVEGFDWRIVFLVVGSVVLYALILKPPGQPRIQLEGGRCQRHLPRGLQLSGVHQGTRPDFPAVAVVSGHELRRP